MKLRKRITVTAYVIGVLILLAILYRTEDYNHEPVHSTKDDFNEGWTIDEEPVELPYNTFNDYYITNTLPEINGDNKVIVFKCRFESIDVMIDGENIYSTKDAYLWNRITNAGCKEITVPLKEAYSNKNITLNIKLHDSWLSTSFSQAFITTNSDYALHLFLDNLFVLVVVIILFASGFIECSIATVFIVKNFVIRKRYTFEALLYTGLFSITTAVWTITYTRLPAILSGNMVRYSIYGYLAFILMPLAFAEMIRAVDEKEGKLLTLIIYFEALLDIALVVLVFAGVIDWDYTVMFAHFMDGLDLVAAIVVAIKAIRSEGNHSERVIMTIGSFIFVIISLWAIVLFKIDREGSFISCFLVALLVYLATQLAVIFNRVGVKAKEEKDFKEAKQYAYTDDLTGLGNRRQFFKVLNDKKYKNASDDFTVVFMDVNRLKYYNDNMGHDVGDELLLGAADCIRKTFHGAKAMCRMGGDEFALVIETDEASLLEMINAFQLQCSKYKSHQIKEISVALGYARKEDHLDSPVTELTRYADDMMFLDKRAFYERTGFERRGIKHAYIVNE